MSTETAAWLDALRLRGVRTEVLWLRLMHYAAATRILSSFSAQF